MNEKQKEAFLKMAEKNLYGERGNIPESLDRLNDIPVCVTAVLGKASLPIHQLLKMGTGSVIELDKQVGEPIDVYVNNKLIAKGELVPQGDKLGIRLVEIIKD